MAHRLFHIYNLLAKPVHQSLILKNCNINGIINGNINILQSQTPIFYLARSTTFFSKYGAEALWKSVTSVSNAGRQRGRAKGAKKGMKDLNKGQIIGVGKVNMMWPGLTGPIMRGSMVLKHQKLPDDPEREAKIIKLRDSMSYSRSRKVHPLERGWTSCKLGGKSIGPPDPVNDEPFDGFDTKIIEHKIVNHMTGNLGRKRAFSTFAITGNKNGLCGIALGKSPESKSALRLAKNRAGAKLIHIPLYNNHTVYHDFFAQFGKTKVFVTKKYEGYGLRCHRALKCACEVIGIKDLYAKVEGAMNYQHIIKAFLIGLLKQKTHKELAEEKQLHLIELRKENFMYPKIIASPSNVRKPEEIKSTEIMDFKQYVLGGRIILKKKKYLPFYTKYKSWECRQRKQEYLRNQDEVRIRMYAEHGELRSFLTDKYPEAKPQLWRKQNKEEE